MAENDFLVWAGASGANVLSQAAYAALAAETIGAGSGIASSAQYNKTARQASIMAAMIAKFIVDQTGADVIDDGTIATIEANFGAALHTLIPLPGSSTPTTNNSSATPGSSLLFARQDHVHPTNFAAFNATPSRVANTVYTNTTGRPMFVTVDFFSTGTSNLALFINGNTSSQLQFPSGGANATLYGMVPPGNTYEFIVLSYAGTVSGWAEVY